VELREIVPRAVVAKPCTIALALLLVTPTAALSANAYEGRWAEDPAWCGRTRASGGDEIPIVITRRAIEQFASVCAVQSVRRQGATWTLRTLCRDEGEDEKAKRTPNTFVLRVDGAQLSMRDNTGVRNFLRCPR
jgi:hypothetical protein